MLIVEKENEAKSESSQDPEPVEEEEEGLPLPPILAYSFDGRPVTIRRKKPRLISNVRQSNVSFTQLLIVIC